jgi:hypothetical protein
VHGIRGGDVGLAQDQLPIVVQAHMRMCERLGECSKKARRCVCVCVCVLCRTHLSVAGCQALSTNPLPITGRIHSSANEGRYLQLVRCE